MPKGCEVHAKEWQRSSCMGIAAVVPAFQLLGKEGPCEARVAAAMQAEDHWTCCASQVHSANRM